MLAHNQEGLQMAISLTGALALQKFADKHGLSGAWVKTTLGTMPPAWKIKIKGEKLLVYDAFGEGKANMFWESPQAVNMLVTTLASADKTDPANSIDNAAPYTLLNGDEALAKLNYEGWAGGQRIKWLKANLPFNYVFSITKANIAVFQNGLQAPVVVWKKEPGCVDKLVAWINEYNSKKMFGLSLTAEAVGYKAKSGLSAVDALVAEKIINAHTAAKIKAALIANNTSACYLTVSENLVGCGVPLKDGTHKKLTFSKDTAGVGAQIAACFGPGVCATAPSSDEDDMAALSLLVADAPAAYAAYKKTKFGALYAMATGASDPADQLDTFVANSAMALLTGKAAPATEAEKTEPQAHEAYPSYVGQLLATPTTPLATAKGLYRPVKGSTPNSRYFLVADMGGLKMAARIKDNKLSLRVEGTDFEKNKKLLGSLGLDVSGTYASTHVILCATGLSDFIDAKRAVAAVIAGLDMAVISPPADLKVILGKGA
jgi:hypothetical protein